MYGLDFGMGVGESRSGKVCGILGKVRYAMWNLLFRAVACGISPNAAVQPLKPGFISLFDRTIPRQ